MTQPYHHGALRQALLDKAESILDRDGIEALTLRAAAREAGVSHAAPAHHFGDLTGLLTALASTGFLRFRHHLQTEIDGASSTPGGRLIGLGRGYVGFARAHPGLFRLMFRSERLDWSSPILSQAGAAAFALLARIDLEAGEQPLAMGPTGLSPAMTRWSLVHGLSTLLVDGRLSGFVEMTEGADIETIIDQVLSSGLGRTRTIAVGRSLDHSHD
jgi:AcrR family transcriptional regulator